MTNVGRQSSNGILATACVCAACALSACMRADTTPPPLTISVNELMVEWIDPSAHELWAREADDQAPKTEADWQHVTRYATQLAAAGATIANGGTGTQDATWAKSPDWKRYSQQLTKAAMACRDAAQNANYDALVSANGELVQVCENCHKAFKPALPTEGRTHRPH
jgi:cytochrome c556